MQRVASALCWIVVLMAASRGFGVDRQPPKAVMVLPVFFVATDQSPPSGKQAADLQKHLVWTQTRYKQMLGGRDTFVLAEGKPRTYRAEHDAAYYRKQEQGAAPQIVDELLRHFKCGRYDCPWVFVAVLMNPKDDFPAGGGRPLNGGNNLGGGIVELSSHGLDQAPNFQSTLQHELGHAFGLPHVDVYGYDMAANMSIMSYNPTHHTHGFKPSATPGILIPEDIRGLALNRRAFQKLRFDPAKDVPKGYNMQEVVTLGPMEIPGHPQ